MAKQTPKEKQEAKARKIARVLVDALYKGEVEAARLWKVSKQTVYNYWDLLDSDLQVGHFFTIEKDRREKAWASKLNKPILKALDYFDKVFENAPATDADTIKAVTEAFSVLVEAKAISQMIDDTNAENRAQDEANAASKAGYQYAIEGTPKRPAATA